VGGLPASNTLYLPGVKLSWPYPTDAVLPQREPSLHYSSFFASCSSRWPCCRFQNRQRDRQQAFRGQHLNVALCESVPQKNLSGGCRGDAAEACPRSKTQGGRNLQALKIGLLGKEDRINLTAGIVYNIVYYRILYCVLYV
jgi:hypothetical protein